MTKHTHNSGIDWRALVGRRSRLQGRSAGDYLGLAVGAPPEKNLSDGSGVLHPSTGVAMFEYPLTYLGVRDYLVSEVGRSNLPDRLAQRGSNEVVRVLHVSEEACKDSFVRSSYGAPCCTPVNGGHPEKVHVKYAPTVMCGSLGTSHRIIETPLGCVPVVVFICNSPAVAESVMSGRNACSLGYTWSALWAEELEGVAEVEAAGGVQCGDSLFVPVRDFDVVHILDTVNHMIVNITAGEARGGTAARLIFDLARASDCASTTLRMQLKLPSAVARRAGIAGDATLTIPDEQVAAMRDALALINQLVPAFESVMTENANLAAQVGEASAALANAEAANAGLMEDAALGRDLAFKEALRKARGAGAPVTEPVNGAGDYSVAGKAVKTAADVQAATVAHVMPEGFARMPEHSRAGFVRGAWDALTSAKTPARRTSGDTDPAATNANLRQALFGDKTPEK